MNALFYNGCMLDVVSHQPHDSRIYERNRIIVYEPTQKVRNEKEKK